MSRVLRLLFVGLVWSAAGEAAGQSVSPNSFIEIHAAGDSFVMGDGLFGPNVKLVLTRSFAVSKSPVTNGQYQGFIGAGGYREPRYWTSNGWRWKERMTQPAFWNNSKFDAPNQPVVGVSWYEAVAYCNWLSLSEGMQPLYDTAGRANLAASGYRLPTEVEWEYAAAKGGPGAVERIFPWGDSWDSRNVVCRVAPAHASSSAPVGSRSPRGDTPQGLVDMSGNVWEWCSDNAQSEAEIAASPHADRHCFRSDARYERMILRGGSWWNDFPNGFRAAFRSLTAPPGSRHDVTGFRVVRQ